MDFKCEIVEKDNKFLRFNLTGQSFVYNQIRKMIGAIIFLFINDYAP